MARHVPARQIPPHTKARHRLPQAVEPVWLPAPACRARHAPCRTPMPLAIDLVEEALGRNVPCGVVVFDAWDLAEAVVRGLARRRQEWIRRLNTNRGLATASVHRRDAHGRPMKRPGPRLAVEALVPLIPAHAYRPVTVRAQPSWGFTLAVRLPSLGQVRLVVSVAHEAWTGRSVVLVTTRVDWSAAKIMALSWQRWPTDPCDQDRQGPLGVNTYRMRSAEAMGTHGCLVFVASSLWHLTCVPTGPERTNPLIPSMGDACRHQGRAVLQKLLACVHDQVSHGATIDHVFAHLFAKPRGRAPG